MDLTIDDVITTDLIVPELDATRRADAIREMADRLVALGRVSDRAQYVDAVLERESEGGDSDEPSRLVLLIAAPAGGDDLHIKLLSRPSRRLIHESFRQKLHDASSEEEVMTVFRDEVKL